MVGEHIILILTGLISLIAGWGSSLIRNRPKKEDNDLNRINIIMEQYEKREERDGERIERLNEEAGALNRQKREIKEELDECEEKRKEGR